MDIPDLRSLRYFVVLAEEMNFTRAAERLGIAQPPLSLQIQKLERMMGCELLHRGRRLSLTNAGERLLAEARRLLDQAEIAVEVTRRTGRGEEGVLRLGVPPSVMLTSLPEAIRRYCVRYPHVSFTLREMATSAIEAALGNGEIDLGFLRETRVRKPLWSWEFLTEPLVAVLPSAHPLAKQPNLKLRALRKEPFVFFPRRVGPAFYDGILADCNDAGFTPDIVQQATQWQSVIALVEAGMGVSVAPACVRKFQWPGVVFRELPDVATKVFASHLEDPPATVSNFLALAERPAARSRERG